MKEHVKTTLYSSLSAILGGALVLGATQFIPQTHSTQQITETVTPQAEAAALGSEQQMINLYRSVSDSVVNVTTRSIQYNQYMEMVPSGGAGSGFVIDKTGHIVTNFHVVKGAQKIYVAFGNQENSYPAKLIGFDERNDLAVLKVQAPAGLLKPVKLGDSSRLQVGQTAVAVGNPFGLGQTITTGVVSSLNRDIQANQNTTMNGLIQTDAAINRGNSGGPLFDSNGRVIGVNTLIYSPSGGSVGIGFSIPINRVKRFIPDLLKYGQVRYPWMGISVRSVSPRLAGILKLPVKQGLMVQQVLQGGAASRAGIRGGSRKVYIGNYPVFLGGDIILSVDGKPMRKETDLSHYLEQQKKVGDNLKVTLLRQGKGQTTVNVRLQAKNN